MKIPPAGAAVLGIESGHMRVARKGVTDQDGVVFTGREDAERLVADLELFQVVTGLRANAGELDPMGLSDSEVRVIIL